ncbi:MAG: PTS sugar transporter subunit IIA [Spirochaetales bacterium]|nr:PTS sugar transporter subunit IIA [Spirochaetales bacterium]
MPISKFADIITRMVDVVFDCNLCELEATDKFNAIKELTSKTESLKSLSSIEQFQDSVIKREEDMSTGLGKGVAIAHGNCPESEKLIVALGVSHKGIEFDAIDKNPVHILFLVANPPDSQKEYLHILSTIVGLLRHESFRRSILTTHDSVLMNTRLRNSLNMSN